MQRKISQYESVSSVVGLVENALLVALAGQRYIRRVLGRPNYENAIHKGTMAAPINNANNNSSAAAAAATTTSSSKKPPAAVADYVTEADFAVQEIAEQIFFHPRYAPKCFHLNKNPTSSSSSSSTSLPAPPPTFTRPSDPPPPIAFIGEEYFPDDPAKSELHHFAWFEDILATEQSKEYNDLLVHFRKACGVEINSSTSIVPANKVDMALLGEAKQRERLESLMMPQHQSKEQQQSSSSIPKSNLFSSSTTLPPSVQIYVDPIDGTNAMLSGKTRVPMTLIGICLSGVPVAGVINRVFAGDPDHLLNREFTMEKSNNSSGSSKKTGDYYPNPCSVDLESNKSYSSSSHKHVCPPTVSLCIEGGPCWIDGRRIIAQQSLNEAFQQKVHGTNEEGHKLAVLASSNGRARHDVIFHKMEPSRWFDTRGCGNKLLALAKSASIVAERQRVLKSQQNLEEVISSSTSNNNNTDHHDDISTEAKAATKAATTTATAEQASSTIAPPKTPKSIRIKSDAMPDDFIFDCFCARSQICKWDSGAPHAFLRWLNADLFRVVDKEEYTFDKVDDANAEPDFEFRPIDYSERVCTETVPEAKKFSGFDVKLEPRVIGCINSSVSALCAERLRAVPITKNSKKNSGGGKMMKMNSNL